MKNYIVVFLFLFAGCNHISSDEDKYIKEISSGDCTNSITIRNSDLLFFFKLSSNQMIQTNKGYLCCLYLSKFRVQYDSFEEFIREILSKQLVLNPSDFTKENVVFNLDKDISTIYRDKGILVLLKQFCNKEENKHFLKGSSLLSLDKEKSILSFCFDNYYKIYQSDALGGYWIYK